MSAERTRQEDGAKTLTVGQSRRTPLVSKTPLKVPLGLCILQSISLAFTGTEVVNKAKSGISCRPIAK